MEMWRGLFCESWLACEKIHESEIGSRYGLLGPGMLLRVLR